jgi:hypothetical protein
MKNLALDEVNKIKDDTKKWIVEGVVPGSAPTPAVA